jgi:hypothetical protein
MNPMNLAENERRQAKRLYEFCLMQLPELDDASQSSQPGML